jgi:hypothetical protein
MPEHVPSGEQPDPTTAMIHEIIETMGSPTPEVPVTPVARPAANTSTRAHVESRIGILLGVTSADEAYAIIDSSLTPPQKSKPEALATWHYHAERTRRQMVGAVLGEKAMALATQRLSAHLDTHDSVVIPTDREHPTRSASLQDFVSTMNHWFTNIVAEVAREDPTGRAMVEAGNRRWPLFRQAVIDWLEYRHKRGKDLNWEIPATETDTIKDITGAYSLNMASEVPNEFILLGQDVDHTGASPEDLARTRLPYFSALTSTGVGVSAPILGPFSAYDPETGANDHHQDTVTPQSLYTAWERNPTPENAQAFLALAENEVVKANLETAGALPGSDKTGRAINPGHCHIDMGIVREQDFVVPPRELLARLGGTGLANTEYLNVTALMSAVGYNAAANTFYKNWPRKPR